MGAVSTAFVKQYGNNVMMLAQQKGSRLRDAVLVKSGVVGEETYLDQIAKTDARKKTTRHADTPIIDADHRRRKIFLYDWEHPTLLDKSDELKMLVDPTNSYVVTAGYALGRAIDQEINDNVFATAYTGKEGGTSESFPGGNSIAHGSTGLTIAKLRSAKQIIDLNDVDDDEPRFIAVTAYQITNLLETTEVTSSDYNSVKALVAGEIDTFLGFKFIRLSSNILTVASSIRSCIAWAKNGIGIAIAQDITARISERADKSYATQVYASLGLGAARIDSDRVVRIYCDES